MTKETAFSLIMTGTMSPSGLGSLAHRILDYVWLGPGELWVNTPRFGWHKATRREQNEIANMVLPFDQAIRSQLLWAEN